MTILLYIYINSTMLFPLQKQVCAINIHTLPYMVYGIHLARSNGIYSNDKKRHNIISSRCTTTKNESGILCRYTVCMYVYECFFSFCIKIIDHNFQGFFQTHTHVRTYIHTYIKAYMITIHLKVSPGILISCTHCWRTLLVLGRQNGNEKQFSQLNNKLEYKLPYKEAKHLMCTRMHIHSGNNSERGSLPVMYVYRTERVRIIYVVICQLYQLAC